MYEFIKTPTGWMVVWGPLPAAAGPETPAPREVIPAAQAREEAAGRAAGLTTAV